jgi:predicted nucleotide-binding protein
MSYHVRVYKHLNLDNTPSMSISPNPVAEVDLTREAIIRFFITPFINGARITSGRHLIEAAEIDSIVVTYTEETSEELLPIMWQEEEKRLADSGQGGTLTSMPKTAAAWRGNDVTDGLFNELRTAAFQDTTAPHKARDIRCKPRVFIGSSAEGLNVAEAIQLGLDYVAECTIWSQGVFGLSVGSLEALTKAMSKYDYAVLVLTPDDVTTKRGATSNSPRDNVLFELGRCIGALGRESTFIVYCRDETLELPTDLAGVTAATYGRHTDGNLRAALGSVCTVLKAAMSIGT